MSESEANKVMCDCGHYASEHSAFTTGYGIDEHGNTFCYECCAAEDRRTMATEGKICLYLDEATLHVINWPGSLKIPVDRITAGKHNIAGTRTDVWFKFAGRPWHGIRYGENTEVCHCKQLRRGK